MQKAALVMGILSIVLLGTLAHAIAATAPVYCAQLRGAAAEKPECTFQTMGECRASVKAKGGGHCYKLHR
jgi:hypothetical protein